MNSITAKIKNIKIEDILCIIIIICPILDMLSYVFRNTFNTSISPSTFLRPILPIAIFITVFFKNKIKKKMIIVSLIYGIYAIIHLYIYTQIMAGCSYGGVISELQYVVNYTFSIMNLFLFAYIFWKKDDEKLTKSILISFAIYVLSLYISIFTGISSTTYIEGMGYKGLYDSGNSLCAILCISLCIILPLIRNKKLMPYVLAITILARNIFNITCWDKNRPFGIYNYSCSLHSSRMFYCNNKQTKNKQENNRVFYARFCTYNNRSSSIWFANI